MMKKQNFSSKTLSSKTSSKSTKTTLNTTTSFTRINTISKHRFPSYSRSYSTLLETTKPLFQSSSASNESGSRLKQVSEAVKNGPSLEEFIENTIKSNTTETTKTTTTRKRRPFRSERLPQWLKRDLPSGETFHGVKRSVRSLNLSTVCEEAKCPNIGECWSGGTATIMLMGDTCTRGCRFCAVKTSKAPPALDTSEPEHVAQAVSEWGLDYVVLTSVDRDDLPDGGAKHFSDTVRYLKEKKPEILVECLTPDFSGSFEAIEQVAKSGLNVFAHNIETVEEMTPFVRDRRAKYRQSLRVLELAKQIVPSLVTKSSIMLGLGETESEVEATLRDLKDVGVEIVTFGQYLQPTKRHMKVQQYISPEQFDSWRVKGEEMGFAYVASGPFVRSSYRAGEFFTKAMLQNRETK